MELHARAGIDDLGIYLSRGNEKKVANAIAALSKAVDRVAVDYSMDQALGDLSKELNPERDNRSVTDPEWVEKGIAGYGCPVHPTQHPGSTSIFTVSGHGECTCRRVLRAGSVRQTKSEEPTNSRVSTTDRSRGRRGGGDDEQSDSSREGRSGHVRTGHVPHDPRQLDRRTSLANVNVYGQSGAASHSRPFETDAYKGAVRSVYDTAGAKTRGRLPLSVAEVVESYILPTSYAGAPLFARNELVLDAGTRLAQRIIDGSRGFDPYVFGRRVQPGASGPKTRLVWMAPLPTTIVGTRYSKRVMEALSRRRPFVWGLRGHEQGAIISEIESRFRYVYSLDFSKFDSTIPARMIDDAFRVARTHLELDEKEMGVWRRYVNDFIHSRIIAPDGHVYQKHRGVPSGSAFTSIIDSIVNLILVSYMFEKCTGHSLNHDRVLVMGDDVIVGSNTRLDKGQLASAASDLGFVLSVEKSTITDTSREASGAFDENHTHFLGHWWVHSQPHRPTKELLQRMVYPERHKRRVPGEYLVRIAAYAMTCREGRELLGAVFPHQDVIQSYMRLADALQLSGWSDDDDVSDVDLPGQLRQRRRVEGQELELPTSKVLGGIFGPWT
jgi:hypothetical protein